MDPIKVDFSGKGKPTEVVIPPDKKVLKIIIAILITIVGGAVSYYFMLPAINLKSLDFYYFSHLFFLAILFLGVIMVFIKECVIVT